MKGDEARGFSSGAKVTSGKKERNVGKKKNKQLLRSIELPSEKRKREKYVFHCVPKTDSGGCAGPFEKQH